MTQFAAAAGHPLTLDAVVETLAAGGTAVDAVIAGALAATACEPVLASLLGGGFLMVREPRGRVGLLDFFVQTPRRKAPPGETDFHAVEADFGETTQRFHIGAGAVAAPGVARGLFDAHRAYGRVPMTELVQPALRIADQGAPISAFTAEVLRIVRPIYTANAQTRALYCGPDGEILAEGAIGRNPDMADALEAYAREGDRLVYEGEIGGALLAFCAEGGHLRAEDLRGYRARARAPLAIARGGARVFLNPAPAAGGTLIAFALSLLDPGAAPLAVAQAFAATSRARLETDLTADPAGGAERLLSTEMIDRYRAQLLGRPAATRGTTHVSAVDAHGMGAALTLSNGEGCGCILPAIGMMPNNMLGEEDLVPGGGNLWSEGVRLSSMMAPTVVEWPDGATAMLGSGGSNRIRTALTQTLMRLIDSGERLAGAVEAPRLHVEGAHAARLDFEDLFPAGDREALLAAFPGGRAWGRRSMFFGGVHAVRRLADGVIEAAGDPRRAGAAFPTG